VEVRRQCTGGGTSARKGDNGGTMEGRMRRVGGVGCFTGARVAFYRGKGEARARGVFNGQQGRRPSMPLITGKGNEEGGHCLMWEMKRRQSGVFPLQ
jgi:hypothetical protein